MDRRRIGQHARRVRDELLGRLRHHRERAQVDHDRGILELAARGEQDDECSRKAIDINFNPFWTVPVSIIKKDLIPRMRKDMNYLSEEKIRIYNGQGQEVQATQVNWNSEDATHFTFRQDLGADVNSLGTVRINIANPYGVYMHDTPEKGIFGDDYRFVSGCVRVQNVRDYITWLLRDTPGWTRDKIDEAIASGQRIDVKLAQPVPVYWVYLTAWVMPTAS